MFQDLRGLLVFAHVVDSKSFSGAAGRLGVTKSAVSKLVAGLEAHLGVQLLVRTTRKLALTEIGERVYASCSRLAEDVDAAQQAAATHRSVVVGHARVTAPAVLGRKYLVPLAVEFLADHPRVSLELDLGDRFLDLVEDRIDVAFRVGRRLTDSSLVARRLAEVRMLTCASPAYLARRGTPKKPADLAAHEWIAHGPGTERSHVVFHKGKVSVTVKRSGRFNCFDGAATVAAAAAGHGIVVAPEFELSDGVARGTLVPLLSGWELDRLFLSALFPPQRHVTTKVRAFVDFVADKWKAPPWRV
jgi:DNA-binding transcriptional LysR family regulator